MAVQKARIARRVVLGTGALFVVWLLGVWPPPVWWRDHEPRCTAMMRLRTDCRKDGRTVRQSPAMRSALLERMVIIAEDSRFRTHHGIDFVELRGAWAAGSRRGASTLTQLKEAVTAVRLELALSKDRIMELYLANAEFGPGLWGVSAASEAYFGVAPSRLNNAQAAALAATLPQPRTSNPAFRPGRMLARRDLILARYYGGKTPVPPADEDSIPVIPPIEPPVIPLDSLIHQP